MEKCADIGEFNDNPDIAQQTKGSARWNGVSKPYSPRTARVISPMYIR